MNRQLEEISEKECVWIKTMVFIKNLLFKIIILWKIILKYVECRTDIIKITIITLNYCL